MGSSLKDDPLDEGEDNLSTTWRPMKIGGGGFMTGIAKSTDLSTIVTRSDTYGAYIWNATSSSWDQLLTRSSMRNVASPHLEPEQWPGVIEIVVAPSDPNLLWMWFSGKVFKSIDRGATWENSFTIGSVIEETGRGITRYMGQKMAVDPADPNHVIVGSVADGVYRTTDGGSNWSLISTGTIPACTIEFGSIFGIIAGHMGICFDATSGLTSGRTSTIYVPVYGSGTYRSTDGGSSWGLLTGGAARVFRAKCLHGNYYAVDVRARVDFDAQTVNFVVGETVTGPSGASGIIVSQTDNGSTGNLILRSAKGEFADNELLTGSIAGSATVTTVDLGDGELRTTHDNQGRSLVRFNGTTWTDITPTGVTDIEGVLVDEADATRVIAVGSGSPLYLSTSSGTPASYGGSIPKTRVSPTIPWLAFTLEDFMSHGETIWIGNEIWNANGIGVAKTTFTGSPSSIEWDYSYSAGIENLTCNEIIKPLGGSILTASWDRAVHKTSDPETFPSVHYPDHNFRHAWDIDYASSDPLFIAICTNAGVPPSFTSAESKFGFKSTDGGATWAGFGETVGTSGTIPLQAGGFWIKLGSCIAVSTPLNFIIVPARNALPWYTTDGGTTWTEVNPTSWTSGDTGFNWTETAHMKCVAADRVSANTFYLFSYATSSLYRSTDGGATWSVRNSTAFTGFVTQTHVKAVPGQAGHLFISGGLDGSGGDVNPSTTKLLRSTDGGTTLSELAGVTIREPYCFGFGKVAPGQSYPAVGFAGWLDGGYGFWVSEDNCVTWRNIGGFPAGWYNHIKSICGDLDEWGTWYAAMSGASYFYRTEAMQGGGDGGVLVSPVVVDIIPAPVVIATRPPRPSKPRKRKPVAKRSKAPGNGVAITASGGAESVRSTV